MSLFLFVGAGSSYELGVPTMDPMVEEFWTYLSRTTLSENEIELLRDDLTDSEKDMEEIVDAARKMVDAGVTADGLHADIGGPESVGVFEKLLHEAEWFVQNACRRIDIRHAQLLWEPTLDVFEDRGLKIATSNYDRAIEIAADSLDIDLHDGFNEFNRDETAEWVGWNDEHDSELLKMHGSLDWFQTESEVVKLRHPLSLYGDIELTVNDRRKLENCLILPSMEKLKREEPFITIDTRMRQVAVDADQAVFVGSSLRDPDLDNLVRLCAGQIPTYTVSPGEPPDIEEASHIQATASEFLMSMLPAAAWKNSINNRLEDFAGMERDSPGILEEMSTAFDEETDFRSESIEHLADQKIELHHSRVKELIEDDEARVRKYALGLVDDCYDPDELEATINELAEDDPNRQVRDEANLLREYLWKTEEVEA